MTLTKNRLKREKRKSLRNNEYYNMQELFDDLYNKSCKGYKFKHLVELITSESNIKLAYRNIKRNNGSKTSGVNKHTIDDIANGNIEEVIKYVQNRLKYYKPNPVKRVWIPKANGKQRPLGIPTIEDRLIQQCIKQILEPICEAKFHKHSYGFRANRSVEHAIARAMFLMNLSTFHYVVDIDIKSFFDNVNHPKLLKQMWNLGIQDKNLIAIINKMIKAEIVGEGIPDKGTPQGGIISPLLSNIVLNELDWWISSQWETHKTHYEYKGRWGDANAKRALKDTSNLKEMYIVRYADDFKIFCKNYEDAQKIFIATQKWLKERLNLEISDEKSKITNLKTNYTDFLGFKLKVKRKNNKWIATSHLANNQMERIHQRLKVETKHLADNPTREQVLKYNSVILGLHTYYNIATEVNTDFKILAYKVLQKQFNLLKKNYRITKDYNLTGMYNKRYGKYNIKTYMVENKALIPIQAVTTQPPMCLSPKINNYTEEGRKANHKYLQKVDVGIMRYIMCNPVKGQSVEYNDNRIALYAGQGGNCSITKRKLEIWNMEVHHKLPKHLKGTDSYKNLTWVLKGVHILIHATKEETITKYLEELKFNKEELKKLNNLRVKSGNCIIKI